MELFETIAKRQSIRRFCPKQLEPGQLRRILEAVNRAPSAGNLQAYEIYVATKPKHRSELSWAAGQLFVADAPVVLVFSAHPARAAERYRERGTSLYAIQDATIACTYAILAATAEGLGTVWVGAFDPDAVRRTIGAGPGLVPVAILPLGHPAEQPEPTPRRPLADLVHEL